MAAKATPQEVQTDAPETAEDVATAAHDAASTALAVTEALGQKITKLQAEQVKLAQLVNGLDRAPGDAVRPSKIDNVMARLEALERTGGQDWTPMMTAHGERVDKLAAAVTKVADAVNAVEEKAGVQPGGQFEDISRDVERLKELDAVTGKTFEVLRNDFDLLQAAVARLERVGVADSQAISQEIHLVVEDKLRRIVANRASFEQDLLARVRNLEDSGLPGGLSAMMPTGSVHADPAVGNVHAKLLELMREVDHIAKGRTAKGGGMNYKFRGIDDAQNAVGQAMRKIGLLLQPEVISWGYVQTPVDGFDDKGRVKTTIWSTSRLTMGYTFVSPDDGSTFTFSMVGEGRDAGDKSGSKAASMACKYALFQALMVPLEVDESDGENPVAESYRDTPAPAQRQAAPVQEPRVEQPSGGYNPAMDSSAMAGADTDDTLMQKAAQAAYYLRQATQQPVEVALPAIKKAKVKIEDLGIGDYKVDGVTLDALIATALQNANAALAARTGGGAQGVTRKGQQQGEGARAAADSPPRDGSKEQYEAALQVLANENSPDEDIDTAMVIVHRYEFGASTPDGGA